MNISGVVLHLANARFGDYYAGMFHMLSAIDYLLPLLALGILAGQSGAKDARKILKAFIAALMVGLLIGFALQESRLLILLCISAFVLLGGLAAFQFRLPLPVTLALSIFVGLLIGLSNGAAWQQGISPLNYSAGIIITSLCIVISISGLALVMQKSWQKITLRVLGSWIAAIGIMYLPFILKQ